MFWQTRSKASVEPGSFARDAGLKPASINEEDRTAELIWSTGAEVRRNSMHGPYLERLSMDARHVDMRRLNSGKAPVLNGHRNGSAQDIIGVVVSARIENGEGIAVVRFSDRSDVEPLWRDIVAGIIRNISVGYHVHEFAESRGKDSEPVLTAVRWEPMEISVVPIPADADAYIRSHGAGVSDGNNQISGDDKSRIAEIQGLAIARLILASDLAGTLQTILSLAACQWRPPERNLCKCVTTKSRRVLKSEASISRAMALQRTEALGLVMNGACDVLQ